MRKLKKLAIATATASVMTLGPLALHAEESDTGQQLSEARLEGSVWTTITLNRHLNPFDISVDVEGNTATLTGTVESDVDRQLAEELALGVDGIDEVNNRLEVDQRAAEADRDDTERRDFATYVGDATTTATVKSKLLWNRHTEGLNIQVTTDEGVVTLTGKVDSSESKELAERLARNTDGVREVHNELEVGRADARARGERARADARADRARDGVRDRDRDDRAQADRRTDREAREDDRDFTDTVSDAWITTKVQASFATTRDVRARDIGVETHDGKVHLSGEVSSEAEKDLAVEIARDIRGVVDVDTSELTVRR